MSRPTTIEQVLQQLDQVVDSSESKGLRAGYFAALYRKVTLRVKEEIDAGELFDDNERMERFDVLFAQRYLDAYRAWLQEGESTRSWQFAFESGKEFWPVVLQHLLLGMNAHIHLDLGVAAAATVRSGDLPALRPDFDRINALLLGLVGEVTEELAWVWPPLRWLTRALGPLDDLIIELGMEQARDGAWAFAERLAELDSLGREEAIRAKDLQLLDRARLLRNPGLLGTVTLGAVRLCERGTVSNIVSILR